MNEDLNKMDSGQLKQHLHEQTALIAWKELQRFFAQGVVIWVDKECDLIDIAIHVAQDQADKIEDLLASAKFAPVSDQQAKTWFKQDASLWSLVVAPFVLVQEKE